LACSQCLCAFLGDIVSFFVGTTYGKSLRSGAVDKFISWGVIGVNKGKLEWTTSTIRAKDNAYVFRIENHTET